MEKNIKKDESGQSLFEAILALAVFIITVVSIAHIFFGANYSATYSVERSKAMLLAREGIEAARSIRDAAFENLETGSFGIIKGTQWQFTTETTYDVTDGKFNRQITITLVEADNTWQVEASATWTAITGSEAEVSLTEYLTAWRLAAPEYTLTLVASPNGGIGNTVSGDGSYTKNTVVDIEAVATTTYIFDEWSAIGGGEIGSTSSATTTYTMPGNNATVTATFTEL